MVSRRDIISVLMLKKLKSPSDFYIRNVVFFGRRHRASYRINRRVSAAPTLAAAHKTRWPAVDKAQQAEPTIGSDHMSPKKKQEIEEKQKPWVQLFKWVWPLAVLPFFVPILLDCLTSLFTHTKISLCNEAILVEAIIFPIVFIREYKPPEDAIPWFGNDKHRLCIVCV